MTSVGNGRQPEIMWTPSEATRANSKLGAYLRWLEQTRDLRLESYDDLWRWSTDSLEDFWESVWTYFHIHSHSDYLRVLDTHRMPGARWFEGASVNYAEHALRHTGSRVAVYGRSQTRGAVDLTLDELRDQVARASAGLERLGIGRGDVVAAYLPNIPEAVVACLATVSLGAIWSSCAPEFGARSIIDRFKQIEPRLLLAVDGYRYGPRSFDRAAEVADIRAGLPTLSHVVWVPYLDPTFEPPAGDSGWNRLTDQRGPLEFVTLPFDHPLYVLYSSGTTGLPKAIIHTHGGITIEHFKALAFHQDLGPGDIYFQVSTTGWMVWNLLLSGLLVGSAIVCFDGDPNYPDPTLLWRLVGELGVTRFGTSAAFLSACQKLGLAPGRGFDLSRLRALGSTGSPLPAEAYRWVYSSVSSELLLNSGSGGTDVCTGFVVGCPLLPVVVGEISGRALGVKVEAFDPEGRSLIDQQGELVVTEPMPSMPLGFWNDPDGSRFRSTYFDMYPGVWRHGDWLTITDRGTCIISGRSDATLNRAGVRLGTAEFYDVVEALEEVSDSLVVHLEDSLGGPGELILLIALSNGHELDLDLEARIRAQLRTQLSPRHVPDRIHAIPGVPRTLTGKKLEVPVKRVLQGEPIDAVTSRGSITSPESLDIIERLGRRGG